MNPDGLAFKNLDTLLNHSAQKKDGILRKYEEQENLESDFFTCHWARLCLRSVISARAIRCHLSLVLPICFCIPMDLISEFFLF